MTPRGTQYKKEYGLELLKIARGDLGSAKALLKSCEGRRENICYLAQQSIEKCIKAVLCAAGYRITHTHDMVALIQQLPVKMLPRGAQEILPLTEFATVRRYEEGFAILSDEDLNNVIRLTEETLAWAEENVKLLGLPSD